MLFWVSSQFKEASDLAHVSRMSNAPYVTFNDPWSVLVKTQPMMVRPKPKQGQSTNFMRPHYCSGALITDKAVLTAGHCVCGFQKDRMQVIESMIYFL